MTRLAFAGKLGKLGSPPSAFCSVPAKIVLGKRLAKAIAPRPRADLAKNWRRVTKNGSINRLRVIVHLLHTQAASMNCVSLSRRKACWGVAVALRLAVQISRDGASKTVMSGIGAVRLQTV